MRTLLSRQGKFYLLFVGVKIFLFFFLHFVYDVWSAPTVQLFIIFNKKDKNKTPDFAWQIQHPLHTLWSDEADLMLSRDVASTSHDFVCQTDSPHLSSLPCTCLFLPLILVSWRPRRRRCVFSASIRAGGHCVCLREINLSEGNSIRACCWCHPVKIHQWRRGHLLSGAEATSSTPAGRWVGLLCVCACKEGLQQGRRRQSVLDWPEAAIGADVPLWVQRSRKTPKLAGREGERERVKSKACEIMHVLYSSHFPPSWFTRCKLNRPPPPFSPLPPLGCLPGGA